MNLEEQPADEGMLCISTEMARPRLLCGDIATKHQEFLTPCRVYTVQEGIRRSCLRTIRNAYIGDIFLIVLACRYNNPPRYPEVRSVSIIDGRNIVSILNENTIRHNTTSGTTS